MIQKIRNSRWVKGVAVMLCMNLLSEMFFPTYTMALTGGPAQPEFGSFSPIGASDMVSLSSGDFSYNIPLMDVGGYPISLGYNGGVGMDDEASWVGLGWDLSVGQINRNVRGIPDDFNGDEMEYEDNIQSNVTVGASFNFQAAAFGFDFPIEALAGNDSINQNASVTLNYNNSTGPSVSLGYGVSANLSRVGSVGFNAQSGQDGLNISPNLSIHAGQKVKLGRLENLGIGAGVSFNSRQGLTSMSLNMNASAVGAEEQTKFRSLNAKRNDRTKSIGSSVGSTLSYVNNTFTPSRRLRMNSYAFTFNGALGSEFFGGEGQGQITGYGSVQKLAESEKEKTLNAYGYMHTENGNKDKSVYDFNREKDGVFSSNTTNLPLTNYTHDIFMVQGQGVGGTFRPYRNQVGYVFDSEVKDLSLSAELGLEFGTGGVVHFGGDVEATVVAGKSGVWEDDNAALQTFEKSTNNQPDYEPTMFKNVGDLSSDMEFGIFESGLFGYDPVRLGQKDAKFDRKLEKKFEPKSGGAVTMQNAYKRNGRQLRNQAILPIEVAKLLDGMGNGPVAYGEETINNASQGHHIGEFQVTRNDGARYVYGLPLYNTKKIEASFAVNGNTGDCASGLVPYTAGLENSADNNKGDKFFNRVTTPGYAHTYLLTSVLSTDYEDRTGDGPTPDDLGTYTKFTYEEPMSYNWRVPFEANYASFNEGLRTDPDDDQGNYVYGEKEMRYLKQIETKTHIAIFHYTNRKDNFGVIGENGGLDEGQVTKKLSSISLYALPEYEADPINAIPIKTVHFEYSYDLCKGVPNNNGSTNLTDDEISNAGGKLTLEKVYFTYRDSKMGKYSGYSFEYDNLNPDYGLKDYDIWGNYKPNDGTCEIVGSPTAPEFNYVEQDKTSADSYSSAWSISKINLPSGGNITPQYESDEYAYVQNKEAHRMFKVAGAGRNAIPDVNDVSQSSATAHLYDDKLVNDHAMYLYVEVDDEYENDSQGFFDDHLAKLGDRGEDKLMYFRFFTNVTKSGSKTVTGADRPENDLQNTDYEYISGYAEIDESISYGTAKHNGQVFASIPIKLVEREGGILSGQEVNPIAKASWNYCRKYLNKYVYNFNASTSPNSPFTGPAIASMVGQLVKPNLIANLFEIFTGPNGRLQNNFIGQRFVKERSWVRLVEPSRRKLGGGCRVKEIILSDIWNDMNSGSTGFETMFYGQEYSYDLPSGISSGVATYEPTGCKENPLIMPTFSTTEHLLAPDEENYVEGPFGESFYPSPTVTYSWVRVQNREAGTNSNQNLKINELNKTGYVVNTFYTSKDYPTIADQTEINAQEDQTNMLGNLLNINIRKHFTATQGYVIHLNDMNGKEESQRVFAEGQNEMLSGIYYNYGSFTSDPLGSTPSVANVKKGKLNNEVKVIHPSGQVDDRVIGVEYDVINDFRQNSTTTVTAGLNGNVAGILLGVIPSVVPTFFPDVFHSEDQFRSASTTKVINTFGILKETIAYDAGASVSTRNLAWDALTGEVLVTETVDEYHDKYYSFNYPAHWYYEGMGAASRNLGLKGLIASSGSNQYQMTNLGGYISSNFLLDGDEIAIRDDGQWKKAWVINLSGNNFELIDIDGNPTNYAFNSPLDGFFSVIRSGRRNLQSAGISSVTLMQNPLKNLNGNDVNFLGQSFMESDATDNWRIIDAGAVDYSDKWPPQCECGIDINQTVYNPFVVNERGVWRAKSSRTYLTGRNNADDPTPRVDGYYTEFDPFYKLSSANNWFKNDNLPWTFTQEVSQFSPYGFELENRDALDRYSAAQYGYNHSFPMAVGANSKYSEIGFDGFEDHDYDGCEENNHFSFRDGTNVTITNEHFHTGRHSAQVAGSSTSTLEKSLDCAEIEDDCDLEVTGLNFNLFAPVGGDYELEVTGSINSSETINYYEWSVSGTPTGGFADFTIDPTTINSSTFELTAPGNTDLNAGDMICITLYVIDVAHCEKVYTQCYQYQP